MDLYLINGQDGISLPEMIDWDIKLCDSDINEEVGVNNLMGVGYNLPSLDIDEEPSPLWAQPYSANSNSSFELDLLGEGTTALMVNPNSVMPFVCSHRGFIAESKVNSNEEDIPDDNSDECIGPSTISVKEENKCQDSKLIKVEVIEHVGENDEANINVEELCEQTGKFDSARQTQDIRPLPVKFVNVSMDGNFIEVTSTKRSSSQKRQVNPFVGEDLIKAYPKPAYSYSCLIAMALKNSQTGCLPVSEIYSFMCHHFPYFKTAPNGWKNSVRHNLSLNKCFEKIEKPPGSGTNGSQRKGCLWAMNPAKITKMDEEVAKWSRKDPTAIKKAMICPDNLELLERGEMKDHAAFDETDSLETEEDSEGVKEEEVEEDVGVDVEDERIYAIDDESDDEMSRVPPSLQPFEPKFANLNKFKILAKSKAISEKSLDLNSVMDFEVSEGMYEELEVSDTRTLLGLNDSTPMYAVDSLDDTLIELPMVKRPRVHNGHLYQPMLNVKRHNISGFRSIKIHSP